MRRRRVWALAALALALVVWGAAVAYTVRSRDLVGLQAALVAYSLYGAAMHLLGAARRRRSAPVEPRQLPFVSVLVPARDEVSVIQETLRCLGQLRYHDARGPRFEVVVLDDRSRDGTGSRAAQVELAVPLRVVRVPEEAPRGKAAVLNVGTQAACGQLLAVFDADARPEPDFLLRAVPLLLEPGVAAVQGRRRLYHRSGGVVARGQEHEFDVYQTVMQRAREQFGAHVLLGGNGMVVNRWALERVGGWNPDALTEDIDLAIRFHAAGWRVRYCEEAVVWEESVASWPALVRQRARWTEGVLRALVQHAARVVRGHMSVAQKLDLLFFLTGSVVIPAAVFASYAYGVVAFVRGVLLPYYLLPLPRALPELLTAGAFAALTLGLVLSSAVELRTARRVLVGLAAYGAFTVHPLLSTPLALVNYGWSVATGQNHWWKTDHGAAPAPAAPQPAWARDGRVAEWLALGVYRRAIP
ncbi:MAG: glycosyltransferase family 2 protein [Armatimonadota bacterium]|nr:glycosyltransferase family 2 protein [Armatimonadota bacterium]MDW8156948.1 glycosyltransferase family 2 protein [Armatimonadota bacterium]